MNTVGDFVSTYAGSKVSVVGLGREGLAVTRVLAREGARVTASDRRDAGALAAAVTALDGYDVTLALGGHDADRLLDCDLLVLSPGVDKRSPLVQEALRRGVGISSETQLFLERCPGTVIGITGSAGKTTTTALVGAMLQEMTGASGEHRRVFVGGNIGFPLLERLPEMDASSLVVLELSSFQLEWLPLSPPVGVVTNVTPNHLDRHDGMAAYLEAKARLVTSQRPTDIAILNADEPNAASLAGRAGGRVAYFSLRADPRAACAADGAFLDGDRLVLRRLGRSDVVCERSDLRVPGAHNVANALAAALAASQVGASVAAMGAAIRAFAGVRHRLQPVARVRGVTYIDDSIATAPERTLAAIAALAGPLVLILGGRDKHLPWDDLARAAVQRCRGVVLIGEAAPLIREHLEAALPRAETAGGPPLERASIVATSSMSEAVRRAAELARPGDAVVLAPGCASFDMYQDFEERGRAFAAEVRRLSENA